jgi:hypothetical protein
LESEGGKSKAREYIEIINGNIPEYKQRWHGLRNRSQKELESKTSPADLKAEEAKLFASAFWKAILPERKGIEALENLLRSTLLARAQSFLPEVKDKLEKHHAEAVGELRTLDANLTEEEIGQFFTTLFNYQREQMTMDKYAKTKHNSDHLAPTHCAFIRARVEDQKLAFGVRIRSGGSILKSLSSAQRGPDYDIKSIPAIGSKTGSDYEKNLAERCEAKPGEHKTEEQDERNTIANIHWLNRPGLPGSVNPDIMNRLIRQETARWPSLVEELIGYVYQACTEYLLSGLSETCRGFTKKKFEYAMAFGRFHRHWPEFYHKYLLPGLDLRKQKAIAEARLVEDDREEDIYEYDPQFIAELRQYRNEIHKKAHTAAHHKFRTVSEKIEDIEPDDIAKASNLHTQEEWTKLEVNEFVESKKIHYRVRANVTQNMMR